MSNDLLRIVFLLVTLAVSPLLLIRFGSLLVGLLGRLPGVSADRWECEDDDVVRVRGIACFACGLFAHLSGVYFLTSLGCSLKVATALMYLPGIFGPFSWRRLWRELPIAADFNFALWFLVQLIIGVSLFNAIGNISTVWINNYGDLTFHFGLITSFVFGENFPPQMHLLAGEPLSYPFFIDLWSATLWQIYPEWSALSVIFTYQWVLMWLPVFFLLNGRRMPLLPWTVLLGGGAYDIVWRYLGLNGVATATTPIYAHNYLDKNYPWTPFLTTIWVTQRSAMMGMLSLLVAMRIFLSSMLLQPCLAAVWNTRLSIVVCGFLVALSPLVHSHFCLLTGLFCGGYLALRCLPQKISHDWRETFSIENVKQLGYFIAVAAIGLIFLPAVHSKVDTFGFALGWYPWKQPDGSKIFSEPVGSMITWLFNAPVWLLSFVVLTLVTKSYRSVFMLVVLFFAGNVIKLSIWEWDQLKVFLAIYLIGISLWATGSFRCFRLSQMYAVLLIIPCCFELAVTMGKMSKLEVYTADDLNAAKAVVEHTAPSAIILASPDHNSPVTLTGRRLFVGYDGTLSSHGLAYEDRKKLLENFDNALLCPLQVQLSKLAKENCPQYLLWGRREQQRFRQAAPGHQQQLKLIAAPYLYSIGPIAK